MLEAILSAVLILGTLGMFIALLPPAGPEDAGSLRVLSSDLLCLLEHRANLPGHPDLAAALSSPGDWEARSPALAADVRAMLPAGTSFYLETPYGTAGDEPPARAVKCVRPFVAFREDDSSVVEAKLVLWRW